MFISKGELRSQTITCISFAKNDFRKRYAGSVVGGFWAYIQTLVMVLIYWLVFQFGFHNGAINGIPFLPWFISGLVPWLLFSDIINSSQGCMFEYSYIVKKIVFNISIIPIAKTLICLFIYIFLIGVTVVITIAYGIFPGVYSLLTLYYLFALLCLVVPIAFVCSTTCVFFRDFSQFVSIALNILMWATPIVWSIEAAPERLRPLFKINPMYYVVCGFRDSLVFGHSTGATLAYSIYFWMVTIVSGFFCIKLYKKMLPHLADLM